MTTRNIPTGYTDTLRVTLDSGTEFAHCTARAPSTVDSCPIDAYEVLDADRAFTRGDTVGSLAQRLGMTILSFRPVLSRS